MCCAISNKVCTAIFFLFIPRVANKQMPKRQMHGKSASQLIKWQHRHTKQHPVHQRSKANKASLELFWIVLIKCKAKKNYRQCCIYNIIYIFLNSRFNTKLHNIGLLCACDQWKNVVYVCYADCKYWIFFFTFDWFWNFVSRANLIQQNSNWSYFGNGAHGCKEFML